MVIITNTSGSYFNFIEFSIQPYSVASVDENTLSLNTLRVITQAISNKSLKSDQEVTLREKYKFAYDEEYVSSLYLKVSDKGSINGVVPLDNNRVIPSMYLPSYVDDVIEYPVKSDFPLIGEKGKIYINIENNTTWRWTGTAYLQITSSGVSSVSGKTGDVLLTPTDVGLSNVSNTADNTKNVLSASKLTTPRVITYSGDVTGSVIFDGSSNVSSNITINKQAIDTKTVYNTTSPTILFSNGTVQVLTLTSNSTLTCNVSNGQSVQILIPPSKYSLDLSGFTIANNFVAISSTTINTLLIINANDVKYLYGTNKG